MHRMMDKACAVQFQRLNKTMKKTRDEHTLFRQQMTERAKNAAYPTQEMLEEADA